MKIIPYETGYRDDMIFMVLEAKNALGRIPTLNEDLLNIEESYLLHGDPFFLAVDHNNRVVGCIGYNSVKGTREIQLHRLYVKASLKRQGIGTALLQAAESHAAARGKTVVRVHLGGKEYVESYSFYPKHGYKMCGERMMKKILQ